MAAQLIDIQDDTRILSGLSLSEHPLRAPMWVDGRNIDFNDGKVRKTAGHIAPFTKPGSAPVRGIQQCIKAGVQTLYWGDQAKLYKWNSATVTTPGTGYTMPLDETVNNAAGFWSLNSWGTWMTATNGTDRPQVDKQAGAGFVTMTDSPLTAEIMIKKGIQMVAFNTNLGGTYMQWCDDDDIEDWTGGNAGTLNIRDMDSDIKAACLLADKIAIYGENTMQLASYPISGFIFGVKFALEGIGGVSKASIVGDGRYNYGLSNRGIWKTDGTTFDYIDTPRVQRFLQERVNWSQKTKINGALYGGINTICWALPLDDDLEPSICLCYNIKNNNFTLRDYGRTSQMPSGIFANPYAAASDGTVYQHLSGVNNGTTPLEAWVQTRPFCAKTEDGELAQTTVDYIRLVLDEYYAATGGFVAYVGVQQHLEEGITWVAADEILDTTGRKFHYNADGAMYISFKFESTGLGDTWAISGLSLYGDTGGDDLL